MSHTDASATRPSTTEPSSSSRSFRPWWRWLLTAFAFPFSGYLAHLVAGSVDSVPAAVFNGVITGAGIGAAQWALLRHRDVGTNWIAATSIGFGAGLAVGAEVVSYRTDITSLVVMGALTGLGVGLAQGATLRKPTLVLGWTMANAALFALGWAVTTSAGIDVSQQWSVFGALGCFTLTLLQSTFIGVFVPAKAATS